MSLGGSGLGLPAKSAAADIAAAIAAFEEEAAGTYLPLAGGALTGDLALGTHKITGLGDPTNPQDAATRAYVLAVRDALLNSAPGALDTLDELAAALGDDANFAATITAALALKAPLASPALTGTPTAPTAAAGTSTTQVATTAFVAAATVPTLQTKTANYTMTTADTLILSNGTTLTITLPSAVTAGATGKQYTVKNINASAATLGATAGTIDGATTKTINQYESFSVVSDGSNWQVV